MRTICFALSVLAFCCGNLARPCAAQTPSQTSSGGLAAIEFLAGFGAGDININSHYRFLPLLLSLDFDIKPWTRTLGIDSEGLIHAQVEPYAAFIASPDTNLETGVAFFLKAGLVPEYWKVQPYVKGGIGFSYMTLHTYEQGSQLNFIEQGGVGVHYFFTEKIAFTVEGRFRHVSNADLAAPNKGINSYTGCAGLTWKF